MNKKGFTLIELLAVIIILGILMIIAIPSVTKYINDSRKNSYIDTARELIGAARNLVNDGKLEMYDTDATYYIDIACLKTENGGKAVSPYGDFVKDKAFVVVTFDGKGYDYYWTSIDDSGQGVKNLIKYDKLDPEIIESDLKTDDIKIDRGLDGRSKVILIRETNNCQKEGSIPAGSQVDGETGEIQVVIYPEGKDKDTVVVGDIVKIKNEEFYVVKHDGSNLVLLARYNLKVGNIYNANTGSKIGEYSSSDSGYGLQSSDSRGNVNGANKYYGGIAFSNSDYWDGKVGSNYPGTYCTSSSGTNCSYVYDSNSNMYQYIQNYKTYLGSIVKEARLMKLEEWYAFKNATTNEWKETSYWLGSAQNNRSIWIVQSSGNYFSETYTLSYFYGVRPVIVI